MRIGIFFGGPSREREVSFMGGRTAYESIDKSLFEPVLVFVSGWGRFYKVEPDFLQQESIRSSLPTLDGFAVYDESFEDDIFTEVGMEAIEPDWFEEHFDMAFLAMHGPDCEDGAIQGLLEWHKIPYTGPGLVGSAIGINKILQNELIALVTGQQKKTATISRDDWEQTDKGAFFASLVEHLGLPVVVKAPHQGSSIGVSIIRTYDLDAFCEAVDKCFFTVCMPAGVWLDMSDKDKDKYAQDIANLDSGIGYPLVLEDTGDYILSPVELVGMLDSLAEEAPDSNMVFASVNAEDDLLFEEFIAGQEFSCGVIQDDDGTAIALPPTEIYNTEAFDFQTKYKTNVARKRIPVGTSLENNRLIQESVATVFKRLGINVYSRIDGFLTPDNRVLLHDPNTIPGMSPASLIFKQMAEIGMNFTDSLTYLIRQSLRERIRTGKDTFRLKQLLLDLDDRLAERKANPAPEKTITFGPSDDAWTKARAEYHRTAAFGAERPVLLYQKSAAETYEIPVNLLFKDTIADLDTALTTPRHPLLIETAERARSVTERYLI
ncbi:D-alanine--D-alanine ligase [Rudanella paleaurantiibacter]|uniref:D-alanine--D-alanine ligase n=1 Tax=Rudanella paleaurantiibacter TaxID=2614655 RepID=A0A7J5TVL9_9BACT|nr:D-alanine--D-alanine ligase [Rudanella paleaurantiibacter]KAB7727065.1 D-alanine--D-alanine ligase [Rudanella paleaurantiibacter]